MKALKLTSGFLIHEVRRRSDDVLLVRHIVDERFGFSWDFARWADPDDWYETWKPMPLPPPPAPYRAFVVESV